jgi:hypothetical protein
MNAIVNVQKYISELREAYSCLESTAKAERKNVKKADADAFRKRTDAAKEIQNFLEVKPDGVIYLAKELEKTKAKLSRYQKFLSELPRNYSYKAAKRSCVTAYKPSELIFKIDLLTKILQENES